MNDNNNSNNQFNAYIDDYMPPQDDNATQASQSAPMQNNQQDDQMVQDNQDDQDMQDNQLNLDNQKDDRDDEESLENQNIFFMLGAEESTEKVKEDFLNELQEVVWEDFLQNDVSLLITSEESVKFNEIMEKKSQAQRDGKKEELEKIQDELVAYLESLIPDLEDIMLEKALDLKADLFSERIAGLREYFASNQDSLNKLDEAEKKMFENKWKTAATIVNGI